MAFRLSMAAPSSRAARSGEGVGTEFYSRAWPCEVHSVVADAFAWVRTGGVDFAIGNFCEMARAGVRSARGGMGGRWERAGGVMAWVGGCRTGFWAVADCRISCINNGIAAVQPDWHSTLYRSAPSRSIPQEAATGMIALREFRRILRLESVRQENEGVKRSDIRFH